MAPLSLRRALFTAGLLLLPLHAAAGSAPGSIRPPDLPDVMVLTDSGARVRFRDLVEGRAVAINFIFTSCPTVCPLMGASFRQVQKLLSGRRGNVTLISISVDPRTDTPAKLAQWSKRFGAGACWTLVTGSKTDIDRILKAFGVYTPDPLSHSPSAFVADTRRGIWRRVDGLAPPATIVSLIDAVTAERAQ